MKINDLDQMKYIISVPLKFGGQILNLALSPIPLGFQEDLANKLIEPTPPFKGFVREKGKLVKDPETRQFIKEYDTENKDYLEKKSRYEQRLNIALTHKALDSSSEITFETALDDENYLESLDKITQELKDFGFLPVHLFQIIKAVTEIDILEDLEKEKKS